MEERRGKQKSKGGASRGGIGVFVSSNKYLATNFEHPAVLVFEFGNAPLKIGCTVIVIIFGK